MSWFFTLIVCKYSSVKTIFSPQDLEKQGASHIWLSVYNLLPSVLISWRISQTCLLFFRIDFLYVHLAFYCLGCKLKVSVYCFKVLSSFLYISTIDFSNHVHLCLFFLKSCFFMFPWKHKVEVFKIVIVSHLEMIFYVSPKECALYPKASIFIGLGYNSKFILLFHEDKFKHSLSQSQQTDSGSSFVLSLFTYLSHILSQDCVVAPSFSLLFPTFSPSVTTLEWGIVFPITLHLTVMRMKVPSVSSEVACPSYLTIPTPPPPPPQISVLLPRLVSVRSLSQLY